LLWIAVVISFQEAIWASDQIPGQFRRPAAFFAMTVASLMMSVPGTHARCS
jgi:hypothetical protein